jgi:hypothetical protein
MEDVENIMRLVQKIMLETGSFQPTVFVKGSERRIAVELQGFGKHDDKRKDMLNAGVMVATKHNVGELETLVFVSEAWMGMNMNIMPSQDPKRVEVLIINSLDVATQEEQMIQFEIVRNKQKKVIDLKKPDLPDGVTVKGTLLPAFLKGYQIISPVTN